MFFSISTVKALRLHLYQLGLDVAEGLQTEAATGEAEAALLGFSPFLDHLASAALPETEAIRRTVLLQRAFVSL